jgi:tRNA A-37 threonylcarbamoyl transferase component Bud32
MAFVVTNPKYQELLRRQGLVCAEQFLGLPSVIISGHPDRNVAQLRLGPVTAEVPAFLKREHRIRLKDRLAAARAGFGLASKSAREARLLQALGRAGIGCPEWLAFGEDGRGRAFLLVRELAGVIDLRRFLAERQAASPGERYRFARHLGQELARVHAAGFDHPDLYSKHVLVDPATGDISFVDWQRSRRRGRVPWPDRCRDLAALHATLADHLASPRERLACLRAYLRETPGSASWNLRQTVQSIEHHTADLHRRRHIREQLQPPLATGVQNLIWLDGEAVCVTRQFWAALDSRLPPWLDYASGAGRRPAVAHTTVLLPGGGSGLLVRRRQHHPLRWLWGLLRRRPPSSPELRQAGLLFRLQRYGVPTPRLLAVGQRPGRFGRMDSFLLIEPLPDTVDLAEWLPRQGSSERGRLLRECADVARRLHDAGCRLAGGALGWPLRVQLRPDAAPAVVLASVDEFAPR